MVPDMVKGDICRHAPVYDCLECVAMIDDAKRSETLSIDIEAVGFSSCDALQHAHTQVHINACFLLPHHAYTHLNQLHVVIRLSPAASPLGALRVCAVDPDGGAEQQHASLSVVRHGIPATRI